MVYKEKRRKELKNINLELADAIYDNLFDESGERGLTPEELVRWILGDYARYRQGPTMRALPIPSISPIVSETEKLMKLSGMFMKSMISQGGIKCSNCTMPLSAEDIEEGKCSKCGAEI